MPLDTRSHLIGTAVLVLLLAACSSPEEDDGPPNGGAGSASPGGSGGVGGAAGQAGTSPPAAGSTASGGGTGGMTPAAGAGGSGSGGVGGSAGSAGSAGGGGTGEMDGGTDAGDPPTVIDDLIGWASEEGDGVTTTTGGMGGATVSPTNEDELLEFAASDDPLIIELEGTYSVPELRVASNKTLIGVGAGATIEGGIHIGGSEDEAVENVIIQNLTVNGATSDADGDAIQISYAHHVWVDHCEIFDGVDGNLDIVRASSWVTVSWTRIHYTSNAPDADHKFASLIGNSDDNGDEDTGRLKVTMHHNHWDEGIVERMPRVRFGEVHVFNNLYTATDNNYAIGGGIEARLVIEANRFEGVNDAHIFYDDEPTAQIVATDDNVYVGTSGDPDEGQGDAFDPPYDYTLDDADQLSDLIRDNVGPR